MGNLYLDDVFMFGFVVASQFSGEFGKRSQEEKAKAKNRAFFFSVTGLKRGPLLASTSSC